MDVPSTPFPPKYLQRQVSYEITFTLILPGNCSHCNILSYEKRKDNMQGFSEISFEKAKKSYVKHKTFHMKLTCCLVKIKQLKKY